MSALRQALEILAATPAQIRTKYGSFTKSALLDKLGRKNPIFLKAKTLLRYSPQAQRSELIKYAESLPTLPAIVTQDNKTFVITKLSQLKPDAKVLNVEIEQMNHYIKLDTELPTKYPYNIIIQAKTDNKTFNSKKIHIDSAEARQILITNYLDLFRNEYNLKNVNFDLQIRILDPKDKTPANRIIVSRPLTAAQQELFKQNLPLLAQDNCLMNILRALGRKNLPAHNPVPLSFDQIDSLARQKASNFEIEFYTELGAIISKPWAATKSCKKQCIPIVVANNHARLIISKQKYTAVVYLDKGDEPILNHTAVVDVNIDDCKGVISYSSITPNGLSIHKYYRPPTPYDEDPAFFGVTSPEQFYFKRFIADFNLHPTPQDQQEIKLAESFIHRRRLTGIARTPYTEIDQNQCYMSFESNPEYCGFPTHNLYRAESSPASNPNLAFIAARFDSELPESYQTFFGQPMTQLITAPVYRYLLSQGVIIHQEYVILAKHHNIDYQKWCKDNVPEDNQKAFSRIFLGMLIAGGISQTKSHFFTGTESEINQITHESQLNDFDYIPHDERSITVKVPSKSTHANFHTHSYILGYAAISMSMKYDELAALGHIPAGYNVDSILIPGIIKLPLDSRPGQWKSVPVDKKKLAFWSGLSTLAVETPPHQFQLRKPYLPAGYQPESQFITGPAGVGKSHPFLHSGTPMLPPTRELRDEFNRAYPNQSMTVQKAFRPDLSDLAYKRLPKPSMPFALIDETTMLSRGQLETILRRANEQNTLLFFAGDFEQIGSIDLPITREFFTSRDIPIREITRTPETPARHQFDYGCKLDKLRGAVSQDSIVQGLFESVSVLPQPSLGVVFVTGQHSIANRINNQFKDSEMIVVRKIRSGKILPGRFLLPMNEIKDQIWWDKTAMADLPPAGKKFIPAYAVTPDSLQGKTFRDETVILDLGSLHRSGTLYSAVTRAVNQTQNKIYLNLNSP